MKFILKLFLVLMPWGIKRLILIKFFDYDIHSSARIGLCWFYPKKLIMEANSKVANFSVAVNLDLVHMQEYSTIGRGNWITGYPTSSKVHFTHQSDRRAELLIGRHSAITRNHHIDCTNSVLIGSYSTIAGYGSQLLTHSIDILESRQDSKPIIIGSYTFIGTDVVILGGSSLPDFSILGAKSLLNKKFLDSHKVYAGVPATMRSSVDANAKYFNRLSGFIN